MKKNVLFKSMRRMLPLCMISLVVGLASCNNDLNTGLGQSWTFESPSDSLESKGIEGCYSASVLVAREKADTIIAVVTEAPEGLSEEQPRKGLYVHLLKSDLQKYDIMVEDIIDFKIENYEVILRENVPCIWEPEFFCRVKPCE